MSQTFMPMVNICSASRVSVEVSEKVSRARSEPFLQLVATTIFLSSSLAAISVKKLLRHLQLTFSPIRKNTGELAHTKHYLRDTSWFRYLLSSKAQGSLVQQHPKWFCFSFVPEENHFYQMLRFLMRLV